MEGIDLHLHTHFSDGTFSPEEVVRRARGARLSAISITDHDSIAGIEPARRAAAGSPEVISGVEVTAGFEGREIHVLGYGFQESAPEMEEYLARARQRRLGRMQTMLERLKQRGIPIRMEEVQAASAQAESIGRPHLAEVLVRKGVVRSLSEAFERFIGDRAPCFVPQALLTVPETVRLIRGHGGVAVLAHPYRIVEDASIPALVEAGIQGLEVYHSDHDSSTTGHYRELARRYGLLETGGSDCHGDRKSRGPLIGTVPVPASLLAPLKAAIHHAGHPV